MIQQFRLKALSTAALVAVAVALIGTSPASATSVPLPNSCAKTTFSEMHGGYLWWYKFKSQRFSQGTYFNKYDIGFTSYPNPVVYVATQERACGHSNY